MPPSARALLGAVLRRLRRRPGSAQPIHTESSHRVKVGEARYLMRRFPELSQYWHSGIESDPVSTSGFVTFCYGIIPSMYAGAQETHLRSMLFDLRERTTDSAVRAFLTTEIAKSDLRSGVVERALCLRSLPPTDPIRRNLNQQIEDANHHYGSRANLVDFLDAAASVNWDLRGRSLVHYFEANVGQLERARILHVSPEKELRAWFEHRAEALGLRYSTLDPFASDVEYKEDLTSARIPDATFDLIICHRVLEHIPDDRAAISEMQRMLAPGGRINVSVPQSMNLAATNDWVVPDRSHHDHVRQYGRDFEQRLTDQGFSVKTITTLLDMTVEQHLAGGTYPMRFYEGTKAA